MIDPSNYGPISLTSIFRKLLERFNFHKTEALSLSGSRITPSSIWHGPLLSQRISRWHDCHSVNPVNYLGYPLYTSTAQRDSYLAGLLRKINTACVLYSHRSLSHVLRVTSVPRAFLEKVKSVIGAFLTRRMFPRISMATLCLPRTLGGLGVLDPVTQQNALQLRWILPLLSLFPPNISSDDDSSIALSQSIVLPSLIQCLLSRLDQWVKRPHTIYSFDFSKFVLRLCFLFVDLRSPVLRVHDGVFSLLFPCMDLLPKDSSDTVINHEASLQLPISASIPPDCIQSLSKTQTKLPCSTAYKFDPASRRLKTKLAAGMDIHPTLTKRFLRLVRQD
ncbi:hypothetical protein G6F46_011756 [Rhizopus delemar]|uniref:Uncharacterized protein n=2 Tax=Rhizopus TaxID=4842 RepID=A0A9P6YT17_9FUNG|nr:hypothetical protein G6F55_012047 [Rhizopus delemar]KAG1534870.1 hypothetical protein G6F51_011849 [Rhizopus arrhizus]KAG1488506.1 hypothetical protein G6F54_012043 [Rhizopus delemar]KAG1498965.1 hypothetical protein G6F53_011626 [Rhizopus delemar]KAG1512710.1 hypothetical protein G6F52_010342 [Rhizopus delemar]